MESRSLQEAVRKIFTDEKTKQEFKADPNKVLTCFSLSETERRAVLRTQMKLRMATDGSVQLTTDPTDYWM